MRAKWDMTKGIERRSIAAQLADWIRTDILAGTWPDFLPGKRTLAARFGVNVKTCASAIELLEGRGVIGGGEAGRRRRILHSQLMVRRNAPALGQRLLIVHQSGTMNLGDYQLLQRMGSVWEKASGESIWAAVDYPRCKQPKLRLEALIARHRPDALLFHMPGPGWHEAVESRLPVYFSGGATNPGLPLSIHACSLGREIERMVLYLRSYGHRRIAIPSEGASDPRWNSIVSALATASGTLPQLGTWEDYCPRFPGNTPDAWEGYWARLFATLRPTALILLEDTHLLSLYGHCQVAGLRIPQDVSLMSFNHEERFEWLRPRPVMMRYPDKQSVAHFRRWVEGGMRPIGRKLVSLEMVAGESVAKCRA